MDCTTLSIHQMISKRNLMPVSKIYRLFWQTINHHNTAAGNMYGLTSHLITSHSC
jgi:hypothetical protein